MIKFRTLMNTKKCLVKAILNYSLLLNLFKPSLKNFSLHLGYTDVGCFTEVLGLYPNPPF